MNYGIDYQTVEAENNKRLNPVEEPELFYEEKLDQLGEKELVELLVENGKESVVFEKIIELFAKRYNSLIQRRSELLKLSASLLESKVPEEYADGIAFRDMAKAMSDEIAEFLTDNLDQSYDI
jgi:hypothetical protein